MEEKATEQYYRKTLEEENWEIGKTDPWEVCQMVIDKIKETPTASANQIIPPEYHELLKVFTEKKTYGTSAPPRSGPPHPTGEGKDTPV